MASKYAKPLEIPAAFPDVLRDFTREVLRQQGKLETKEQIYAYGVQYFRELLVRRDGAAGANLAATSASAATPATPLYVKASDEDIATALRKAVTEAAQPSNGILTSIELQRAMQHASEALQLTALETHALTAEADENDDGTILPADFVPLALQAVLRLRASRPQRLARGAALSSNGQPEAESDVVLHGLLQDEFESLLREILQRADRDDTHVLPRRMFMDCLRDADLGLTRREVNLLMAAAPIAAIDQSVDPSEEDAGSIAYLDFLAICFPLLRDLFQQGVLDGPSDQDGVAQYLTEVFAGGDADGSGLLAMGELARLLRAADVGLTRLQIVAVLAEAQDDADGWVHYDKFAVHVAGMVLVLASFDSQQTFATFLRQHRSSSEYYTILDHNQHAFEQTLSRAFEALDESHRGLLARQDVIATLQTAFADISPRQVRCLLALAEPDEMGDVEYSLLLHSAFQALQKLHEYDLMLVEA